MRNLLCLCTVLAIVCPVASQAQPALGALVFEDGNQIGTVTTSTNGLLNVSGGDALFSSVTLTAGGPPFLADPNFASQATDITTATGFTGTHTLTIAVTQVDLTSALGLTSFADTLTSTFAGSSASETTSTYFDPADTAFALTDLLATQACSTSSACLTKTTNTDESVTGPFSETTVYSATFIGGGSANQSSSQITVSVPEPGNAGWLGFAMIAVGVSRRGRAGLMRRPQTSCETSLGAPAT